MKAARGIFANSLFIAFASACLAQAPSRDKRTPLDEALNLYQQFSGKTDLHSPNPPNLSQFQKPIPTSETSGRQMGPLFELFITGLLFIPLGEAIVKAV